MDSQRWGTAKNKNASGYFQDEKFIIPEKFRCNLDPIHKSIVSRRTVYSFSFTKQGITFGWAFVRAAKLGLLRYYSALHCRERDEAKGCRSGRMYMGQMGFLRKKGNCQAVTQLSCCNFHPLCFFTYNIPFFVRMQLV